MARIRVYELANELGTSSKALLAWLTEQGVGVRSASSTLHPIDVKRVRENWVAPPAPIPSPVTPPRSHVRTTCDDLDHPAQPIPGPERAWDVQGCACGRTRHSAARVLLAADRIYRTVPQQPAPTPAPRQSLPRERREPRSPRAPRSSITPVKAAPRESRWKRPPTPVVTIGKLADVLGDSPERLAAEMRAAGVRIRWRRERDPIYKAVVDRDVAEELIAHRRMPGYRRPPPRTSPDISRALRPPPPPLPRANRREEGGGSVDQWLIPPLIEQAPSTPLPDAPPTPMPPTGPRRLPHRRDWLARRRGLSGLTGELAQAWAGLSHAQPIWATTEMIAAISHVTTPDREIGDYVEVPDGLLAFADPLQASGHTIAALSWRYERADETMRVHTWTPTINPTTADADWLPSHAIRLPIGERWPTGAPDQEIIDLTRLWWAAIAERAPGREPHEPARPEDTAADTPSAGAESPPHEPPTPGSAPAAAGEEVRTRLQIWRTTSTSAPGRASRSQRRRTVDGWWVRSHWQRRTVTVDGRLEKRRVFVHRHRRGDEPGMAPRPVSVYVLRP